MPFLLEERRDRVAMLKEMMGRADVTISEKYRRIIEAYQVEMDYGRTIEAYEAKLGDGDDARTVQFLRDRPCRPPLPDPRRQGDRLLGRDGKSWVVDDSYEGSFKEGHRGREEDPRAGDARHPGACAEGSLR